MKLLRHGQLGQERPGLFHSDGTIRDLTGIVPEIGGTAISDEGIAMLRNVNASSLPIIAEGNTPRTLCCRNRKVHLHWSELRRSRSGIRYGRAAGTGDFHESNLGHLRPE
jgi:hypothetical protein